MKKTIPVAVWQKIQPILDKHKHLFDPIDSPNFALVLFDKDAFVDNSFSFECGFQDESGNFRIRYKPMNYNLNFPSEELVNIDGLAHRLEVWLNILQAYADTPTIYDNDPFVKNYEHEFAGFFQTADEDADTSAFDMPQQLLLAQYIDKAIEKLESHKESANVRESFELDNLIEDAKSLKGILTKLTKKQTFAKLNKFWAKSRKFSIDLIKDLLTEFKKEAIKTLTEKTLKGELSWETIAGYLS